MMQEECLAEILGKDVTYLVVTNRDLAHVRFGSAFYSKGADYYSLGGRITCTHTKSKVYLSYRVIGGSGL